MSMEGARPQQEPNPNKQFYSSDPYEILGLSRDATQDDIKRARKVLAGRYHPDKNSHADANEILQNVNAAADTLLGKRANRSTGGATQARESNARTEGSSARKSERWTSSSAEQAQRREGPQNAAFNENLRDVEREFQSILKDGFSSFIYGGRGTEANTAERLDQWVERAQARGISIEQIVSIGNKPELQDLISKRIVGEALSSGTGGHAPFPGPDNVLKYIQKWRDLGIELGPRLQLPEVRKALADQVVEGIKGNNASILPENAEQVGRFIESWKKVGVDLEKVVATPEVSELLTTRAALAIRGRAYGSHPKQIKEFSEKWSKAGIQLGDLINSPQVSTALTDVALGKMTHHRNTEFKPFVQEWMNAGWRPNQTILSGMGKAPNV